MKKLVILACSVVAILFMQSAKAQTLDDILKAHFDATGQDALLKVEGYKITGKLYQGGIEIPIESYTKRPGKIRFQGTFMGMTFVQTFNGSEGWELNPFQGSTTPEPMSADALDDMKLSADIDGFLWNWKEKGYLVTYEGTEDVEGTPCYKIKVVVKNEDVYYVYIDQDSYMLLRTNSKTMVQGVEVESDTYYSNFMLVDGIAFPGKSEIKYSGQTALSFTFEKYELNVAILDGLFEKPVTSEPAIENK